MFFNPENNTKKSFLLLSPDQSFFYDSGKTSTQKISLKGIPEFLKTLGIASSYHISIESPHLNMKPLNLLPLKGVRGWIENRNFFISTIKAETQSSFVHARMNADLSKLSHAAGNIRQRSTLLVTLNQKDIIAQSLESSLKAKGDNLTFSFYMMDILRLGVDLFRDTILSPDAQGIFLTITPGVGIRHWIVIEGSVRFSRVHPFPQNPTETADMILCEVRQTWAYAERTQRPSLPSYALWAIVPQEFQHIFSESDLGCSAVHIKTPQQIAKIWGMLSFNTVDEVIARWVSAKDRASLITHVKGVRLPPARPVRRMLQFSALLMFILALMTLYETYQTKHYLTHRITSMTSEISKLQETFIDEDGHDIPSMEIMIELREMIKKHDIANTKSSFYETLAMLKKAVDGIFLVSELTWQAKDILQLKLLLTPHPVLENPKDAMGAYAHAKKILQDAWSDWILATESAPYKSGGQESLTSDSLRRDAQTPLAHWVWEKRT